MDTSTLGSRLKKARELKDLSQQDLATKTGVSKGTISMSERDITELTTSNLIAICRALGISTEYILFGDTMERNDEWKLLSATENGLALRQAVLNLHKNKKLSSLYVTLLDLREDQVDLLINTATFLAEQNRKLRAERLENEQSDQKT